MRTLVLAASTLLAASSPGVASRAQSTDRPPAGKAVGTDTIPDRRPLPPEVAQEVTDAFNAPGTLRATGALEIERDREVRSDVAVLDGPLIVAGHVTGGIVAINSNVVLRTGARVDGGILVVGGTVSGRGDASVVGDVRVYQQRAEVRLEGDRLIATIRVSDDDERWWRRRQRWHHQSYSDLRLFSARTYNRVEGLPIYLGPTLVQRFHGGTLELDGYGIFRTGDNLEWKSNNLGHDVKTVLRFGTREGVAIGGRLFNTVSPVESWQLTDTEVGLASFFLHRDYRDYWNRHGGSGSLSLFLGRDVDLTGTLSSERWASRETLDPFTLFRNGAVWRANPALDEGTFNIANATLRIDTRDNRDAPTSGWYIIADYEHGTGTTTSFAPTSPNVRTVGSSASAAPTTYDRGFLDFRRYNHITRDAEINLRVVAGGWLSGDELPLQRRFSIGGPGTIPGYDFRRTTSGDDPLTCAGGGFVPIGVPAQCDRMILAQAEYRGDLSFGVFDWGDSWFATGWGHGVVRWVLFTDAGRGWLVDNQAGGLNYSAGSIPSLNSWRTDLGVGLMFNQVGLYVAKAVSTSREPANIFVRVKRRF